MKDFISDLGVVPSALDPMLIYCDNNGAIASAKRAKVSQEFQAYQVSVSLHS
jgi:hypothetical protein